MALHLPSGRFFSILLLLFLLLNTQVWSQTPGLIYKPAVGSGKVVLDPNGDGYVSIPRVPPGFEGTRDEGPTFSEIPYRPFPALEREPTGDLTTGSSGGHTDLVSAADIGSTGSPIAAYFNGTHLMFRIRLGGASTASKGYSVLIDTNNTFGDLVAGGNPSTTPNPGFEFEVVLASNFNVSIYDHRGNPNGGGIIWSGSADQFSQRAIAASTYSNNADYFYDFYVPLSAFPTTGPDLLTATTPLRMSGITITSAQSGITGSVSDVGGVNFATYGFSKQRAWAALINTFPATSPSQLQNGAFAKIAANPPIVNAGILAGQTAISGTSSEAAGSVITVYQNGTVIGTTTVTATGTWTLSGLAVTLLKANDIITATVLPTNKSASGLSNQVVVQAGICISPPAPIITSLGNSGNSRRFEGTTSFIGNQRIRIYSTGAPTTIITSVDINATTTGTVWATPYISMTENSFFATTTPLVNSVPSGCESLRSNQICFRNGTPSVNNQIVQITSLVYDGIAHSSSTSDTWREVPTNLTSISGTLNLNGTSVAGNITLFKNATATSVSTAFTTSTTTWTINLPAAFIAELKPGDVVNVRTDITLSGGGQTTCPNAYSRHSDLLFVQATTSAPTINQPGCGLVTTLTGTSSEAAGTVLQFYRDGSQGIRNGTIITQNGNTTPITAVVTTQGTWAVNFATTTGGGIPAGIPITARAKASGKVRSVNSTAVAGTLPLSIPAGAAFSINPITAPASTSELVNISGKAPASTSNVTYKLTITIDGTVFPTVNSTTSGDWALNGLSGMEIYPGAIVSATFTTDAATCPSAPITTTVQCRQLTTTFTATVNTPSICYNGRASVTLANSEQGVSYALINNGTLTGASVLGTGQAITLTSGPLVVSTTALSIRAVVPGSSCAPTTGIGGNLTVNVAAQPTQPTSLTASVTSGCAAVTTNITLSGLSANFTYQLINADTKALIGQAVSAGVSPSTSLTLATSLRIFTTTRFGVIITPSGTNPCPSESNLSTTVTVTPGPSLQRSVTIDKPTPCAGEQVTIRVATEYNPEYTYVIRDNTGTMIGTSFTGTGLVVSRTTTYTNGITAARSFYVEVTGGCATNARLETTVHATPSTTPVVAAAGANQTVCGTVTLQGNAASPGIGTWTKTGGPSGGVIVSPNDPRTTVTDLPSGNHTFTWTIVTSCGQSTPVTSTSTVSVAINCPAEYLIIPPRYVNEYKPSDVLAIADDKDGGIKSAVLVEGTFLPAWAILHPNGVIAVRTGFTPSAGTYNMVVRTTDQFNSTTDSPITLTVYGLAPTVTPLPVELVSFKAALRNNQIVLQWVTASELDNDRFEVERSSDGRTYKKIGTVAGKGTSSLMNRYSFIDKAPLQGINYYRLRQVDFNGEFEFSYPISLVVGHQPAATMFTAYPNPVESDLHLSIYTPTAEPVQIMIFDLNGKQLYHHTFELEEGTTVKNISVKELPTGMYLLRMTGKQTQLSTKILKK